MNAIHGQPTMKFQYFEFTSTNRLLRLLSSKCPFNYFSIIQSKQQKFLLCLSMKMLSLHMPSNKQCNHFHDISKHLVQSKSAFYGRLAEVSSVAPKKISRQFTFTNQQGIRAKIRNHGEKWHQTGNDELCTWACAQYQLL